MIITLRQDDKDTATTCNKMIKTLLQLQPATMITTMLQHNATCDHDNDTATTTTDDAKAGKQSLQTAMGSGQPASSSKSKQSLQTAMGSGQSARSKQASKQQQDKTRQQTKDYNYYYKYRSYYQITKISRNILAHMPHKYTPLFGW